MLDDCAAGARETDYPAGEDVPVNSNAGGPEGASQTGTAAKSRSAGSERVLDGITVVGCSAEGAAAVPQTAGTDSLHGTGSEDADIIYSSSWKASFWHYSLLLGLSVTICLANCT